MDCRILRHATLKADGHLGCDDSVGYGINLGHVSMAPGWRLRDVLEGPVYSHVRSAFRDGRVPWPGTCEGCDLFSAGAEPNDTLARRIELLVEPTLACNIACACCLRKQIVAKGRSTTGLDPAILARFVESARTDGITIDQVHYIGWGEPLMHGDFRALFDIVKNGAPEANQMVTTAGNVDFRSTVGDAALDRLIVSCDGSRQEPYGRYRRGGDLETVIRFMRDCRRYGDPGTFLEWKYILFEFNDSDADLLRAQEIADEIGVDSLLFIITNSKWHSERFTVDSPERVPLVSPVASMSPAAAMNAVAIEARGFRPSPETGEGRGHIDLCTVSVGKFLTVEGWALDRSGAAVDRIELLIDGEVRARSRTNLRRLDVVAVHPDAAGANCGYLFRLPVDPAALPGTVEVRCSGPSGAFVLGGRPNWRMSSSGLKRRRDLPSIAPPILESA